MDSILHTQNHIGFVPPTAFECRQYYRVSRCDFHEQLYTNTSVDVSKVSILPFYMPMYLLHSAYAIAKGRLGVLVESRFHELVQETSMRHHLKALTYIH